MTARCCRSPPDFSCARWPPSRSCWWWKRVGCSRPGHSQRQIAADIPKTDRVVGKDFACDNENGAGRGYRIRVPSMDFRWCQQIFRGSNPGGQRRANRWNRFIQRPTASERLVESDEVVGRPLARGDMARFEIELLAFGVEDVQKICEAAIVSLRGDLRCLARRNQGAIKAFEAFQLCPVGSTGIVDLPNRHQYRLLVGDKGFMPLQVGDFYLCVERPEIEHGHVERRAKRSNPCDG